MDNRSESDPLPPDSIRHLLPAWRHKHDRRHPDFVSGPQLAKAIDVDPGLINQIETGRGTASARVLELIAHHFGKDPDTIAEYRRAHARQQLAAGSYELVETSRLDRIEQAIAELGRRETLFAEMVAGLLTEQTELLERLEKAIRSLGVPNGVSLQDHLVELVRDTAARRERPGRATRSESR